MKVNLANASKVALERVMRESGLSLTAEQVRDIAETESSCLSECGRISFGESVAVQVVREFAESKFITGDSTSQMLMELVEAFYELREGFSASVADTDILESLEEAFGGDAAGDVSLAAALAGEELSKRLGHEVYEIADADGKVYRWDLERWVDDAIGGHLHSVAQDCWDPEEWHDDVMADGWCGERWDDADGWYRERWEDVDE